MQGTITEIKPTTVARRPAVRIVADTATGDWKLFTSNLDLVQGLKVGDRINFESHKQKLPGMKYGINSIDSIAKAGGGSSASQGRGSSGGDAREDFALRFASNVVGSALTAGAIKDRTEIADWAQYAYDTMMGLGDTGEEDSPDDDGFPDDVPF